MAGLSQLGEYLLLEQIGQGGMGVVYKAQHRLLKRLVAVKLLPGSLDSDSAALTRFLREIEALGRLDHRHLVRAFDAGNDQGRLFLVLEHLQGQTLGQYLKQHGKASVTDACTWTIQAALGLQHAHEHGLVHRDIKPANLFRAAQSGKPPVIKILDLGLVQWQVQAASQQLTATGQTLGTPEYMSPEQIEHGTALDIRTDIYSLGCTLFHLLAGQPPFPGGTYHQVLAGHLLNPPPSLRELRSDVSTELEIIIGKMLAKKPAERYTTPSEVASVLQAFLQADRVPCPNCGKWLRVPGHAQGKRIACPVCKTLVTPSVTLEQPASSSKPEAPPAVNSSALPEAQPVFPSEIRLPRPPEPPTLLERTGYRLWIVAGVITLVAGITLVIGLGWWFSQPRSAPTSTLGSNVPWQSVELASPPNMDRFPEVALRVHLPSSMQGTLKVLEDGQEVWQGPLIPSKSLDELSLVLDTSGSMANSNKMTEAKRAILNLFDRLSPQTQCGLVLFHHQIHTKLALRKEREALREQIRMAEPAGGTAYQDAVWEALKLFPKNDADKHRSILLLTDGRDINSSHSLKETIMEAKAGMVPVITIGLGKRGQQDYTRTVLVLDRSGSMRLDEKINSLQKAALRFLRLMPAENADVAIISFNDRVDSSERFTANKETLRGYIESLFPAGETAIYDAACEGIEMLASSMAKDDRPMRLTALILTDGIDNRSRLSPVDVISKAKAANVRVFMLGLGHRREIDEPTMRRITQATGGQYYHIEDASKLTEIFEQLSIQLHDDGIDETSLRQLAEQTGGEYYHVEEANRLPNLLTDIAQRQGNTHTITFRSRRATAPAPAGTWTVLVQRGN